MIKYMLAIVFFIVNSTLILGQFFSNGALTSHTIEFKGKGHDFEQIIRNPDSTYIAYNRTDRGNYFVLMSKELKQQSGKFIHFEYAGEFQRLNTIFWLNGTCYVFVTFYNVKHHKRYLFYTTLDHKTLELSPHLIKVAELTIEYEKDYFIVRPNHVNKQIVILGVVRSREIHFDKPHTYHLTTNYWILNRQMQIIHSKKGVDIRLKHFSRNFSVLDVEYKNNGKFILYCRNFEYNPEYIKTAKNSAVFWNKFKRSTYAAILFSLDRKPVWFETKYRDILLDAKFISNDSVIHLVGIQIPRRKQGLENLTVISSQSILHVALSCDSLSLITDSLFTMYNSQHNTVAGIHVTKDDKVLFVLEKYTLSKTYTPGKTTHTITYYSDGTEDHAIDRTSSKTTAYHNYSDFLVGSIQEDIFEVKKYSRTTTMKYPRKSPVSLFITKNGCSVAFPDILIHLDSSLNLIDRIRIETVFEEGDKPSERVRCYINEKTTSQSFVVAARVGIDTKFQLHEIPDVID